jgi:hypothetical protein
VPRAQVFLSYSHKDKSWLDVLIIHLKPYLRGGSFTAWSDQQLAPGSTWLGDIQDALLNTKVAVLLVTPDFLASDFINERELGPLLKEAHQGGVKVLWVPVRRSAYMETPLKDYQAVLDPAKPVAEWRKEKRDSAWVKICQEIQKAIREPEPSGTSIPRSQSSTGSKRAPLSDETRASHANFRPSPIESQPIQPGTHTTNVPEPIRLLHLSDLHFTASTPVSARLQWVLDDLRGNRGLGIPKLDYLVISGDFTDKGSLEGFEKAYDLASRLSQEFDLLTERCVFVPGNHDVCDLPNAYEWRRRPDGLIEGEWVKQGEIILVRDPQKYSLRFKSFSDKFYHTFFKKPYPTDYKAQGISIPFWDTGLQFLALNSCWQIDEFYRKRSGLHPEAVAHAIKQATKQESEARKSGQLSPDRPVLRIAVWHHAVAGPEQIKDTDILGNLQKNGVRLVLHGDVHEIRRELIGYWHIDKLYGVGSRSFGGRVESRPESTPRLYNLLEISRDLKVVRVHTR